MDVVLAFTAGWICALAVVEVVEWLFFFRGGYMKRRKMSRRGSKRLFTATASKTHRKNVQSRPMRGGIRL